MNRFLQCAFFTATGIVCSGGLMSAQDLASWRPLKVGTLPSGYKVYRLSPNGRFATATRDELSLDFTGFDLNTGKSYSWPHFKKTTVESFPSVGWSEPYCWQLLGNEKGDAVALDLKDATTGVVKHTFRWKTSIYEQTLLAQMSADGKSVSVLGTGAIKMFSLKNHLLKKQVALKGMFDPINEGPAHYAISPDSQKLFGCLNGETRVWNVENGRRLKTWKADKGFEGAPNFEALGAHIITYPSLPVTNGLTFSFVNSETGKLKWKTNMGALPSISERGDEVFLPLKNFCEVRDAFSGRVLRQLPGPRSSDAGILKATHNFIYTLNAKNEILRWRAR